jgi:hypothetical protein
MAQKINIGNQSNDGTGDSIREAFRKVNENFTELYGVNNLGDGLYLTKLKDTPDVLTPSTTQTAALLVTDYFGNTLTQKLMIAGQGIVISNTGSQVVISNPAAALSTDTSPELGGDLGGNSFRGKNFRDPIDPQDLATKYYVDNNGYASKTNFYVSNNGRDSFPPEVPTYKYGREWAYAFKTINRACEAAEEIISTSTLELSAYSQPITLNNGAVTATIYSAEVSSVIYGDTRLIINFGAYAGTDQWISRDIRPGQYIKGRYSQTLAFINDLGHASAVSIPGYNEALCYRDTGLIVDALAQDLLFNTSSQVTFAGLQYYAQGNTLVPGSQTTTTNAITHLKGLAQRIVVSDWTGGTRYQSGVQQTTSTTAVGTLDQQNIVGEDFDVVLNILQNGNVTGLTDAIVPNNLTTSTNAATFNAYLLLQANKDYLAAEVNAFLATSVPSYSYDVAAFTKYINFVTDSVSFDLLYSGNRQATQAGAYYWGYDGSTSVIEGEQIATQAAYDFIKSIVDEVIGGFTIGTTQQSIAGVISPVPQVTSFNTGSTAEVTILTTLINTLTNIITTGPTVAPELNPISQVASTDTNVVYAANLLNLNREFIQAETVAWVKNNYTSGQFEYYDVVLKEVPNGIGFTNDEPLDYTVSVPTTQISILIESGVYYEQLPIRVPASTSLRGDEFRRVIVKPDNGETGSNGYSTSKWANLYFRRDSEWDGITKASSGGRNGLSTPGQEYGFHYLQDPTDPNSDPKLNADMDVFLLNDTTLIRGISSQGHGGFMCVLDPEGQVLTKSPYIQNCTSFSKSINKKTFSGGVFVDGFTGELKALADDATTYWLGTMTISVSGLDYRQPQTPFSLFVKGNRYEVDYVSGWTSTTGAAVLHLNPRAAGGIAAANGTIPMWPIRDGGNGYSEPPKIIFSPPTEPGGVVIQGTGTINVAGTLTSITINNPGTGYTEDITVQFVGGGAPLANAASFTLSSSTIASGFIGIVPAQLDLGMAGNKSILTADFTQVNDLGYGIALTNNAFGENVSVFTYYNQVAYYANNGAQLRSVNGANGYGEFALKAEGADPNEVPTPVLLATDMVQTGTVVTGIINLSGGGTVNASNTTSGATVYIRNYSYTPYNQSEIEVDHGNVLDNQGNTIGLQIYPIVSVSTVSTVIGTLAQLNISGGNSLFGAAVGGLKYPISTGTVITIRNKNVIRFTGINASTIVRPSTALQFTESTGTTYRVLSYQSTESAGDVKAILRDSFEYVDITSLPSQWPPFQPSVSVIKVNDLSATEASRITSSTSSVYTQLTFGWKGVVHKITKYQSAADLGTAYGQITISPALASTLTNYANTGSGVILRAGLRQYTNGEITTRISTLRVSGHDLYNIGAGSAESSNVPNDIYGPSRGIISPDKERVEVGKGRVYAITTDQNGNFKVGDLFQVDQGSGDLTIAGSLTLSQVDGLGFKRGTFVREFSNGEDNLVRESSDTVNTEAALVSYVNKRLGVTRTGALVTKIGSGFLDLTGLQSMAGNIGMAGYDIDMVSGRVLNLSTSTAGGITVSKMAIPKAYADTKISLAGTATIDTITGLADSAQGIMTGSLQLNRDPIATDHNFVAATKQYVDKTSLVSTLNDVSFTAWPNLPADKDFVMFNSTTKVINTGTSTPVWQTSTQITNVANNTTAITNTATSSGGGSDITVSRSSNQVTFKLVGGQGAANPITNHHINNNAAIQQSKLAMNAATTRANATSINQSNLGLGSFDSAYFSATNGWISLASTTNFPITASCACGTVAGLSAGNGMCWGVGTTFNGSAAATLGTNAVSGFDTNKLVCRDSSGDFSVRNACVCGSVVKAGTNGSGDIGQSDNRFSVAYINTVYGNLSGNAATANFADLAERYQADAPYAPCTVLEFGGACEVTIATDGTRRVAGVVSTDPAYLMNGSLSGENTVALALTGRVPTKVRGRVRKGDMMVAAGDGYARPDYNPVLGSVIGKALEDFDGVEGIIEIVVGRL